ncbi:lytic murein transglycosylase B [Rhabdochromatium marinum]|uniref:lytic murein transglycosylase B n=1 Tax=Rhabdochromatium marinum TaxID=48729 RepID=UPI001F5B975F|nr:lytic murein transglycosylase B [Rhabdochromatium marinum]
MLLLIGALLMLTGCGTQTIKASAATEPSTHHTTPSATASLERASATSPQSVVQPASAAPAFTTDAVKRRPQARDTGHLIKVAASHGHGVRGDYAKNPALGRFIARMEADGFSRAELERLFSQVERQQWIVDYMNRSAPRVRPASGPNGAWLRYRAKFLKESNVATGTEFWHQHAATLARAERQYGVPAEYLVAIIGVETRWGGYMGSHRIIDALTTLAFDYPRRAEFFTDELAYYLVMAREEGFDPLQPVGSFAGAMGLGQFMPSSFHAYAVDFDGSGHRDLWNIDDAIGSIANYFAGHGWRSGQPVAMQVQVARALPTSLDTGFPSNYSVAELTTLGVSASRLPANQQRLSLLRLDVGQGYKYWVGFDNFYVITRYNHSTYYAMAVHQLAQALKARQGHAPRTLLTDEIPPPKARS